MALTLHEIEIARERISPHILQTPILRLNTLDKPLAVKHTQIGVHANHRLFQTARRAEQILSLTQAERKRGIVAASSATMARRSPMPQNARCEGDRRLPYTAAKIKADTIREWGAEIVQCDASERFECAEGVPRAERHWCRRSMTKPLWPARGTAALEIGAMRDFPIIVPVSGGGLIGGIATAIKGVAPRFLSTAQSLPLCRDTPRA